MSFTSSEPTLYADADVPFKEIFHGKFGGHFGLIKYLENRQNQLSVMFTMDETSDTEKQRILLGITAMREAINLISLLKKKPV
jgi:hypothetical protein